ncbi:MAG TPA: hypothetical protein PKK60_03055 [archaeon]|nr:hypothetical protein [archaeon]
MKSNSRIQETIVPQRETSNAQGTIEYLVIIAIVVVISLVVVALLLGIFEDNSDVGTTAQQIQTQTLPVALNEAILGTGTNANGLIVLTNNTGDIIRDVRIVIDGKDHNYFGVNIAQGNKVTFKLDTLEQPCPSGQNSIIKNIIIIYTTRNGLEQKQKIENVTLQCVPTQSPISTVNPKEETQEEEEEPETPEPTPTDIVDPELENLSSVVDGENITLTFRAWDNNAIQKFEITEDQENYEEIEQELIEDYLDGNYYTTLKDGLGYETEYTFCIKVTDYNNNYTEECDTNTTGFSPPEIIVYNSNGAIYEIGDELEVEFEISNNSRGAEECTLYIDDESILTIDGGYDDGIQYLYYDLVDLSAETHEYYVSCIDSSNNTGISETKTFIMQDAIITELRVGLVGYWPLDETSGTTVTDYSDNPVNGVLRRGGTFTTEGIVNGAYVGSSSFIRIPNNSKFAIGTGSLSWNYWVKDLGSTSGARMLTYGTHGGAGYPGYANFHHTSSISYGMARTGYESITWNGNVGTFTWPKSGWTQITMVINRTTNQMKIYINGGESVLTKDVSAFHSGYNIIPNCDLCIFASCQSSGSCLTGDSYTELMPNGKIDEVAIWNRVLTEDEIEALFNSGNGLSLIQ